MPEPMTMMLAGQAAGSLMKGIGGYKSGKGASKAAIATANYNRMLAGISADQQRAAGDLTAARMRSQADVDYDVGMYRVNSLLDQAHTTDFQTDFNVALQRRKSAQTVAAKKAAWGTTGMTHSGSFALGAVMDEYDNLVAESVIRTQGEIASLNLRNQAALNKWSTQRNLDVAYSDAEMARYNKQVAAVDILNRGQSQQYQGQLKASQARQQGTNALISGIAGAAMNGYFASQVPTPAGSVPTLPADNIPLQYKAITNAELNAIGINTNPFYAHPNTS